MIIHLAILGFGFLMGFLLGDKFTRRIFGIGLTKIGFWLEGTTKPEKTDSNPWQVNLKDKENK